MNVLSLCTGAGGFDLGVRAAGHTVVGMCEIDRWCRAVLRRHWPDTPLYGDIGQLASVRHAELVIGGTPCQDLSRAGRGDGLGGASSALFWQFCRVAGSVPWIAWENVRGALSANDGEDFAAVLWSLTGFYPTVPKDGWRTSGVCAGRDRTAVWRVLDAQYFGLAQRRQRLFVVAGPGGECGPEVLALGEGAGRHPETSATTWQDIATPLGRGPGRRDLDGHGAYIAVTENQRGELCLNPVANALTTSGNGKPGQGRAVVLVGDAVRQLTPLECERLQGWPDGWTAYTDSGQRINDGHRYNMIGNGVAAPVAEWIAGRLPAFWPRKC